MESANPTIAAPMGTSSINIRYTMRLFKNMHTSAGSADRRRLSMDRGGGRGRKKEKRGSRLLTGVWCAAVEMFWLLMF